MVHRIAHRVASADTLDFWADRLGSEGVVDVRGGRRAALRRSGGLEHELVVVDVPDAPLAARSTEVPDEHALQGFHAVYAAVANPRRSRGAADRRAGLRGRRATTPSRRAATARGGRSSSSPAPGRGFGGAGTSTTSPGRTPIDEHDAWREKVRRGRAAATPVIDRFYFKSVYFREPGGILYELATIGPGFTTDEPLETLGERLALPPDFERLRAQVEPLLTPLPDMRQWRPAPVA